MTERERWIIYPLLILVAGDLRSAAISPVARPARNSCRTLAPADQIAGGSWRRPSDARMRHIPAGDAGVQRMKAREFEVLGRRQSASWSCTRTDRKELGGCVGIFSPQGETEVSLHGRSTGGQIEVVAPLDPVDPRAQVSARSGCRGTGTRNSVRPSPLPDEKRAAGRRGRRQTEGRKSQHARYARKAGRPANDRTSRRRRNQVPSSLPTKSRRPRHHRRNARA